MVQTNLGDIQLILPFQRFQFEPITLDREVLYNVEVQVSGEEQIGLFSVVEIGYVTRFRGVGRSSTPALLSINEMDEMWHLKLDFDLNVPRNPELVFWARWRISSRLPSSSPLPSVSIDIDSDSSIRSREQLLLDG